jgi:heat shock protein HslJ
MKKIITALSIAALLLTSCKTKDKIVKETENTAALPLIGTAWQALHVSDTTGKGTVMHYNKAFVLRFEDSTRLQLRLDANTCRNSYSQDGNNISIAEVFACTKKCCDAKDGLELRDMLAQKTWKISLDDNKNLRLRSDANIDILFKAVKETE